MFSILPLLAGSSWPNRAFFALAALAAIGVGGHALAAVEPHSPYETTRAYAALGRLTLANGVTEQGIDTTALVLRFGSERQKKRWILGGGVAAFLYDDNATFSQQVNNENGPGNRVSSTAGAISLYVEGGYHVALTQRLQASLLAGYEYQLFSSRGVVNCRNCYEESIDVSTGLYIRPRLIYRPNNRWFTGVSFAQYWDVDAKRNVAIVIGRTY